MSQLYVPDGTWTLCTEGKKIPRIQVSSQSTVRIAGGKLAATKDDRFDGNFVCFKMVAAGAVVGALAAAAIAASGGAVLGAFLAAGAAGAATGSVAGGLAGKAPSICSLLCKPAQWTEIHPKVKFEKKEALLQNATLSCLLGGLVTIKMPNLQEAIDMAKLTNHIYDEGAPIADGYSVATDLPSDISDMEELPWKYDDTGFQARMYKGPNNENILVFEGTTPSSLVDWKNNLQQGVGLESKQYKQANELVKRLKKNGVKVDTVAGHSLGGGLAALAGTKLNLPTYTYNAAGVHDKTFKRYDIDMENAKNIQAYSSDDDILTKLSDNREKLLGKLGWLGGLATLTGSLPRNNGQRMELDTEVSWLPNPAEGHNPKYIIEVLEKELAAQGKSVIVSAKNK